MIHSPYKGIECMEEISLWESFVDEVPASFFCFIELLGLLDWVLCLLANGVKSSDSDDEDRLKYGEAVFMSDFSTFLLFWTTLPLRLEGDLYLNLSRALNFELLVSFVWSGGEWLMFFTLSNFLFEGFIAEGYKTLYFCVFNGTSYL